MPAMAFASPVLRGREEEWRRFAQELEGSRRHEYESFRRRLGIRAERVWLERTRGGEIAIAYLEAAEPEMVVARLAASEEPFDMWFKEKLAEFHGCDPSRKVSLELIFAHPEAAETNKEELRA